MKSAPSSARAAMGEVYLAQDTQLRRPVAIKLLSSEFTHDIDRLHRFEHESYAASSLNHPNILTIHEIGSQDGLHYIVTEYIDGESLRDRLHHSRMQLREVLEVATQVASALSAAHQAGIVHRDIKPDTLYPLAHLGLARAAALTGDVSKSRKAYQDFLALWKDAILMSLFYKKPNKNTRS